MKYLTFKKVALSLLLIAVVTILLMYFLGGLNPYTIEASSISFSEEDFADFSAVDEASLQRDKVIGENDKYYLLFDEATTIVTIAKKGTASEPSKCEVVFQTADAELVYGTQEERDQAKKDGTDKKSSLFSLGSNVNVSFANSETGKLMNEIYNSYTNSVQFYNSISEEYERHYKVKYLEENGKINGVQILYQIGKFDAGKDYFPSQLSKVDYYSENPEVIEMNQYSLEELLRGNLMFFYRVIDGVLQYREEAKVYSKEAALYIREHNLGYFEPEDEAKYLDGDEQISPEYSGGITFTVIDPTFYTSYGTHINTSDSPLTSNPFIGANELSPIMTSYYIFSTQTNTYQWKGTGASSQRALLNYLYKEHQEVYSNKGIVYEDGTPVMRGGIPAKDEDGNYLYDEEGNPVRELFTLEKVSNINEKFGVTSVSSLPVFQVGLEIKLDGDSLSTTVIGNSLKDADDGVNGDIFSHDYILADVEVMPNLTHTIDTDAEGMIIVPDGSGAIIEFNNGKTTLGYSDINKPIYGYDYSFVAKRATETTESILLGMYGYVNISTQRGMIAIVEDGASQSNIYAGTSSNNNRAYFISAVREYEIVTAGTGWNESNFTKWTKNKSLADLKYRYIILEQDELDYVSVAKKYREYLVDKYDLEEKDTTTENVVDINFLGAFEGYDLFLGIKYKTENSLTTFSQAKTIIDELLNNNVNNISVDYTAWTDDEMEYYATDHLKVSSALGGKKGILALRDYLSSKNIEFYPEMYVTSAKGYDYDFGVMKYTAKSVGNYYARHYPYNIATLMPDKEFNPTYYINPQFYNPMSKELIESYDKLGIDGVYLKDLGNTKVANYARDKEIYSGLATAYQQNAMSLFDSEYSNIKISAPFDYAFPYVTSAINIPTKASSYGMFDATIPFYQLVVSGLFDYTTVEINGMNDNSAEWFLTKAIETGSNLHFIISAEDPEILLDTDYTQYYKSYYNNWKDTIISMNNTINTLGIHEGELVNHELIREGDVILKDISIVEYSNGLRIIVNSSNSDTSVKVDGTTYNVSKYGYTVIGGK